MSESARSLASTTVITQRVRQVMVRKGWTAQQLVDELRKAGVSWTRSVAANLLAGRRSYVSIDELFALAYVLDCSPVHLLLPIDGDQQIQEYAVTPEEWAPVNRVREWICGRVPFGDQDPRVFFSEVPVHEWRSPA